MLFNQNRGRPKVVLDYPSYEKSGGQIFFSHFKWMPSGEEHETVFSVFTLFDAALMGRDNKILKSVVTVCTHCTITLPC